MATDTIPHCNQEAYTEVASELSRNPPNSQLPPAPFASKDSRIHPILEARFCLLAKDRLSALQLTQQIAAKGIFFLNFSQFCYQRKDSQ